MIMDTKEKDLSQIIEKKEIRKLKSQRNGLRSVWFGLGTFGLIGWSIVVPLILGVLLGQWLDSQHPQRFSWTLSLLLAGLTIGCINVWHWIDKENKNIDKEQE
jgi:ATP synthase protein I